MTIVVGDPAALPPDAGVCSPWVTLDQLPDGSPVTQNDLDVATDVLYALSGHRFPGECEVTFRPLLCRCAAPSFCGCYEPASVRIGGLLEVLSVTVDGQPVPSSEWRLVDGMDLIRLAGADGRRRRWPTCQRIDLPATEPGTFEIVARVGARPPVSGVNAVKVLAGEFAKARTDTGSCRLPRRVQTVTRQNVTAAMLDPMEFLENGRTGILEVDLFLIAYPAGGQAVVLSPDLPRNRRIT